MKEFELIHQYFSERGPVRKDVVLGIGDDAAILKVPAEQQLVVATDTLVEGTHFFKDADPKSVGHKALVANISDFAAMGAEPAWASVALTIPEADLTWVEGFSQGLYEVAEYYNVQVIGGDTTQGPLSVSISLKGFVPENRALLRSGAKTGDWIYVTGDLGQSALVVDVLSKKLEIEPSVLIAAEQKFHFPNARLAAAQVLRHAATSAIDISDGLVQDLQHILKASKVSADLNLEQLPIAEVLVNNLSPEQALQYALTGGEEFELLFTVPEEHRAFLEQNATAMGVKYTKIGQIKGGEHGISYLQNGDKISTPFICDSGYEHFS
jgi:thiamine-monophosphate kinase